MRISDGLALCILLRWFRFTFNVASQGNYHSNASAAQTFFFFFLNLGDCHCMEASSHLPASEH